MIWSNRGSHADKKVALWANTNINSHLGIDVTTFTAFASRDFPTRKPNLLSSLTASHWTLIPSLDSDKVALTLYEITDTERIWKDSGSGADKDISSYRAIEPVDYFSLGDIGVPTHSKPSFSILAKAKKDDVLAAPTGYRQRWNDKGSGADKDVALYEPICSAGYIALGQVTISSRCSQPSGDDIRCVNSTYTVKGSWKFLWDDSGSDADKDVSVWRVIPSKSKPGQGVWAISAVPCHCKMDRTPYVLNPDYVQYVTSKPVKRYIMNSLSYELDDYQVFGPELEILARTVVYNYGDTEQVVVRTIEYGYEETHSWDETKGLEIGVEISVEAGIPELLTSTVGLMSKLKLIALVDTIIINV